MKYFCIFGGGGIRGISYVGAIKALEELNVEFRGFAGSSVGAVFAALYGIGLSTDEIKEAFMEVSLDLFRDINFSFGKAFALSKGELFLSWLRELISNKVGRESVTFSDIDKDIIILSVDLTSGKYCEFSRFETPEFEIAQAVRASVSMPGLFKPVILEDKCLVDGDLMQGRPLWRSSRNLCPDDARILEFRLEDFEGSRQIKSGLDYINAVYNVLQGFCSEFIADMYKERDKFDYIKINCKDVSVADFAISKRRKEELVEVGYNTTKAYFSDFYVNKKQGLFENYYQIYLYVLKLKNHIANINYKEAQIALGELFMHLCEDGRFIDLLIYRELIDFKKIFLSNYKIMRFWRIPTLNERGLILKKLDEILAKLNDKVIELKV